MTDEQKKQVVFKYADQVATALRGKFPDCAVYVRLIEAPEYNFVELAVKRKRDNSEWTVAYSDDFFFEMSDVAVKQTRAKRILNDLHVHMGIHE